MYINIIKVITLPTPSENKLPYITYTKTKF